MTTVPAEKRTDTACGWIAHGDCNIARIMEACRDYLATGAAEVGWVLDLDLLNLPDGVGGHLSASDLTIGEQADIAQMCGVGWDRINPVASAEQAVAVLVALVENRTALGRDDAENVVRRITSGQFEQAYSFAERRPADPT